MQATGEAATGTARPFVERMSAGEAEGAELAELRRELGLVQRKREALARGIDEREEKAKKE